MTRAAAAVVGLLALSTACGPSTGSGATGDVDGSPDGATEAVPDAGPLADAGPDAAPLAGFGEPCADKGDCQSNVCIFVAGGGICSELCVAGSCADGYGCFGVLGLIDPGEVVDVCVPDNPQLCTPCLTPGECSILGTDLCLEYPDGKSFCAQDCSSVGCPAGYECLEVDVDGVLSQQCIPASGACDCGPGSDPLVEVCAIPTDFGTCQGTRTCQGDGGWGACEPPSLFDAPDGDFVDDNCDGIDGDLTAAIFVATTGSDVAGCGLSYVDPCRTISHAIVRALQEAKKEVYIQAGDYSEVVVLQNGIHLYGGYDVNWQRSHHTLPAHRVRIFGGLDAAPGGATQYLAVRAHNLIVPTRIADLTVVGPTALGAVGQSGRSSYAIHAESAMLELERVTIVAGNGASAPAGTAGLNASNVSFTTAMRGGNGTPAEQSFQFCSTSFADGGGGGTNSCGAGVNPGAGGGGSGGSKDTSCGCGGICAGPCGNCSARAGTVGTSAVVSQTNDFGFRGAGGATCSAGGHANAGRIQNGPAGSGASSSTGFLSNAYWYARAGSSGGVGQHGSGGGGGGGSGGCDTGTDTRGAGGGGGGAGGCAAQAGGGGGGGGGGSFGIFSIGSTVTASGCTIVRGNGASGGVGGVGGRGQSGGPGGAGGSAGGQTGAGGNGGVGAHGGHGGGGGGGAGGMSVGIFRHGGVLVHDCVVSGGSAGPAGAGGLSAPSAPVAERDGNDGGSGQSGLLTTQYACLSPSGC